MTNSLDVQLLLELNHFVPQDHLAAKLLYFPTDNAIIRGLPIVWPLFHYWFSPEYRDRRSRILIGVFAACFATVLSISSQLAFQIQTRPFLDPALQLRGADIVPAAGFDHTSSFPSDTSTLFFALSTILLLENRKVGVFAFVWTFVMVGVIRVAYGWHYPSDVLGSLVVGPATVYAFSRIAVLRAVVDKALQRMEPRLYVVNALLFLVMADATYLFPAGQQFFHGVKDVGKAVIHHWNVSALKPPSGEKTSSSHDRLPR
jgi:undecaprenyl-diphosphatase